MNGGGTSKRGQETQREQVAGCTRCAHFFFICKVLQVFYVQCQHPCPLLPFFCTPTQSTCPLRCMFHSGLPLHPPLILTVTKDMSIGTCFCAGPPCQLRLQPNTKMCCMGMFFVLGCSLLSPTTLAPNTIHGHIFVA